MSNVYEPPRVEIIDLTANDIITASGSIDDYKPGNGWGDPNHNHYGPPGQNKKY